MSSAHSSYVGLAAAIAFVFISHRTAEARAPGPPRSEQQQSVDEWREYRTRYLVMSVPTSWVENPGQWERVRFDSPEGIFDAAVWIGTHEKGKWSSLDEFAATSRLEFSPRTIHGAQWMESRRNSEGSTEITLVGFFNDELVQVMIVYENESEQRLKYAPVAERMAESLKLPRE